MHYSANAGRFCTNGARTLEFWSWLRNVWNLRLPSPACKSLDTVLPKLEELRGLGVRIALMISGQATPQLPRPDSHYNTEADKSFTDIIGSRQEGLMEGILYMQKLNLSTVAEGVEKNSQLNYLRNGCQKCRVICSANPSCFRFAAVGSHLI